MLFFDESFHPLPLFPHDFFIPTITSKSVEESSVFISVGEPKRPALQAPSIFFLLEDFIAGFF
jgi:hypothetical protein